MNSVQDKERLVRLETKLEAMIGLLTEIRNESKDNVTRLELERIEKQIGSVLVDVKALEEKYDQVNIKVIKLIATLSTIIAGTSFIMKHFFK